MFTSGFLKISGDSSKAEIGVIENVKDYISKVYNSAAAAIETEDGKKLLKNHAVTGALGGGVAGATQSPGDRVGGGLRGAAFGAATGVASGAVHAGLPAKVKK